MIHAVEMALERAEIGEDGGFGPVSFPADLDVFQGHFPDHPLVPGIYLIELARQVAQRVSGRPSHIQEICEAKFTAEIPPDAPVHGRIQLIASGEDASCTVWLTVGDVDAAKIRLRLRLS